VIPPLLCCRQSETPRSPEKKKARLDPFAELRDCRPPTAVATQQAAIESELAQYKALNFKPDDAVDTLTFWKQNANTFPILSMTARRVLCISASSAQSERDFSSVGRTVTDIRSRLSASKVDTLEVLRSGVRLGIV